VGGWGWQHTTPGGASGRGRCGLQPPPSGLGMCRPPCRCVVEARVVSVHCSVSVRIPRPCTAPDFSGKQLSRVQTASLACCLSPACQPACWLPADIWNSVQLHRAQLQALTCTQAPWQLHRLLLAAHTTHPTAPACSLPAAGRALLAWRDSQPAAQDAKQEGAQS
jgi:hypothetical protein